MTTDLAVAEAPLPDEPYDPSDPDEAVGSRLTHGQTGGGDEQPRRTWQPVDLGPVLAGTYCPPVPTVGAREDDIGTFYPGRQHTLASESEGGKTWLMLAQAAVEMNRGNGVVFLDLEDDPGGVVGRLLTFGVTRETIRNLFAYIQPEEPVNVLGNQGDLAQALGDLRPTLAVIDGVTEAMVMHGLNPLDNKDAATFGRLVPRRIAETGPATVCLDHVTKSPEGRGRYALGAVHKLNGLNGAAFLLENRRPFGVGLTGRSTVLISKDRPGQLRRHAVRTSGDRHWFGDLVLTSHDETFVSYSIDPPAEKEEHFRPTVLMARVSDAMVRAPEDLTLRGILDRVKGKRAEDVRSAVAALVDEGNVVVRKEGSSHLHKLVKPFGDES